MISKLASITEKLSPNRLKILTNTSWLLADRILRMGLSLVVGVWVARYLGPDQFGLYNYAFAFALIFNTVANLGLDGIVVRNLVRDPESKNELMGTTIGLKLLAQIAAIVLGIGSIIVLRPTDSVSHWLVGIIVVGMLFEGFYGIDFWFQAQTQSKYSTLAKTIAFVASSIVKVVFIQIQAPVTYFAATYLIETAVTAIGLLWFYQSQGHLIKSWKFCRKTAIALLIDSWTLILSSFVIMIYMRIDQVMLGQLVNDRAVGLYSAAVKISELWYFVPTALTSSVYPSIIRAKSESAEKYANQLQKVLDWLSAMGYAVAIVGTIFSTQIVVLLYGQEYAEAGTVLALHIWTGVFVASGILRSSWTTIEGYMSFALASTAMGAGINVVLNYTLIPKHGGIGAAIATLVAQALASYCATALFSHTRPFFWMQTKSLLLPGLILRLARTKTL
ncbi:putative polysaccharide biosynthesis protein [Leptolyngbya sp. NIES-3755]|nr:putative polysaccharide biosynthesis protein [Leptolyngbya sp. NIES-3755]